MKVNKLRKLVPALLLLTALCACGPKEEPAASSAPPEEPSVSTLAPVEPEPELVEKYEERYQKFRRFFPE